MLHLPAMTLSLFFSLAAAPGDDVGDGPSLELPLPPGAEARLGTTRFRCAGSAERMELAPDGATVLVATVDGRLVSFDASTGRVLRSTERLGGSVNGLHFEPGGGLRVSVFEGGQVRLDGAFAEVERRWSERRPSSVVPLPDGGELLLDGSRRSFEMLGPDGEPRGSHALEGDAAYADFAVTADGARVFALANHRKSRHEFTAEVSEYAVETGEVLGSHRVEGLAAREIAVSPDGSRGLLAGLEGTVHLLDLATGELVAEAREHTGRTTALAWSADGARCASGSNDGNVVLYDASLLAAKRTLPAHRGLVAGIAFSEDGARVYSAGQDGRVRVFDALSGADLLPLAGHEGPVVSLAWLPDGDEVLTGGQDGQVLRWSRTGELLASYFGNLGPVDAVAVSPDGDRFAFSGRDGSTQLLDAASGDVIHRLQDVELAARDVAFSPDGSRLVVASADGKARVWDTGTGARVVVLDSGAPIANSVAWSPDGERIAVGTSVVRLFTAKEGFILRDFPGPRAPVSAVRYTRTGERLITASADRKIRAWRAEEGEELFAVGGPLGRPESLSVSPDGRLAATCSLGDRAVILLDIEAGAEWSRFEVPGHEVMSVAISPDGLRVASGLADGTVLIWSM